MRTRAVLINVNARELSLPRSCKSYLLPQWFALPPTGHPHSCCINVREVCKQGINLCFHIVVGRNDVQEILDDAKVKIDAECICGQSYPTACHTVGKHWTDGVLLVPYTGMVATGITG